MSEGTIAKAKAILDGSARGTDCKDVARAYVEPINEPIVVDLVGGVASVVTTERSQA